MPENLGKDPFDARAARPFYRYRRRVSLYSAILSRGYNIDLDDETGARWAELLMFRRAADDYLDNDNGESADDRMRTFVDFCLMDRAGEHYPHLSHENLGDDTSAQLMINTLDLLSFGAKAKEAESPLRLAAARILEGRSVARLLTSLASEEMRSQEQFDRFSLHLESLGSWASIGNSAFGLKGDAKRGEVAIPFSVKNFSALIALQAIYSRNLLRHKGLEYSEDLF